MLRFLFWRLVQCVIVLWTVYTVTFGLLMLAPGDPFIGEKKPPESVRKGLAEKYGLDYLAVSQRAGYIAKAYCRYLGNAVRGDLGPSIQYENWTVTEVIGSSLPVSTSLGCAALLIALLGGAAAGTLGAVYKGRWPDIALTVITL